MENIILDMDGTLIDFYVERGNVYIVPRPNLSAFLKYVFDNFVRVSIWTNGTEMWYIRCFCECLVEHIPEGYDFDFVITLSDKLVKNRSTDPKRLSLIYKKYDNYNENNTIMIDDSEHTLLDNIDNGILIPSFSHDPNCANDTDMELLHIIPYITSIIQNMNQQIEIF